MIADFSTDRDGIFAGDNPFQIARDWLHDATGTEPNDPNAAAVASVDADGLPNVRILLLKDIEDAAFVFYTNYTSPTGVELEAAGKAAFNLHWKTLERQIRVRGTVVREDGEAANTYYKSRPLGSRIGAYASHQSQPLTCRKDLMDRHDQLSQQLGEDPERPQHWGGYRITPLEIEFWAAGEFRLHNRFRWTRGTASDAWEIRRLNP